MAVAPGYDANRFGRVPVDRTRNRAVTDVYEPGSTFKLVTVAGVLSERLVTPSTAFTLPYELHVADRVIHDSHPRGTERMSVARSSPTRRTSARSRSRTCSAGTGSSAGSAASASATRPGSTSPASAPGSCSRRRSGRDRRSATSRSARASASRRSRWPRPTRRSRTRASPCSRTSSRASPAGPGGAERRRVVGRASPRRSRRSCAGSSTRAAPGSAAAIPGYYVAGKTGTAQKPDPQGGYSSTKYVSFLRRLRACDEAAARRPGQRGRAARLDLGRRRRGPGVPADRPLRAAVPRGTAGRPLDSGTES